MANPKDDGTKEVMLNVAGTILEPVAEVLASGKFTEIDEPVGEGEKVIGEFTGFEKALFTVLNGLAEEYQEFLNSGNASPDNIEFLKKKAMFDAYKDLLGASCRRIGKATWEGRAMAYREGHKIVSVPEGEEDEMSCRLAAIIFGGGMGV